MLQEDKAECEKQIDRFEEKLRQMNQEIDRRVAAKV